MQLAGEPHDRSGYAAFQARPRRKTFTTATLRRETPWGQRGPRHAAGPSKKNFNLDARDQTQSPPHISSRLAECHELRHVGGSKPSGPDRRIELVADRSSRTPFDPSAQVGARVL